MRNKKWGNPIEIEVRDRIFLSVCAYAYEIESDSIITDAKYDELSKEIDLSISTGNKKMDKFFRMEFEDFTGKWIHAHPGLEKIKEIYNEFYAF